MAKNSKLATVNFELILERLRTGEHLAAISSEYSVSRQSLWQRVKQLPGYRQAIEDGQEVRLQTIIGDLAKLGLGVPPRRPTKHDAVDYDTEMDNYKSARQAWADGADVSDFELNRLEKLFRQESWLAARSFPARWGEKSMMHLTVGLSLDQILAQMEQDDGRPPIDGEAYEAEDIEEVAQTLSGLDK